MVESVYELQRLRAQRRQKLGAKLAKELNQVGMTVVVTLDDGTEKTTKTTSPPWQLGHGDWVIGLEGISGGYDITRVRKAEVGA